MICPFCCSDNTSCIESRQTSPEVRRRRYHCCDCGKRFSTLEQVAQLEPKKIKITTNRRTLKWLK